MKKIEIVQVVITLQTYNYLYDGSDTSDAHLVRDREMSFTGKAHACHKFLNEHDLDVAQTFQRQ